MKVLTVVSMAAAMSAAAWAQQGDADREAERRAERLKDWLKLDDAQTQKIKEIYKSDRENQDKLEKERQDKIRELLTDEQKKTYDEGLQGMGGGGRGGRGGGQGGPFGGGQGGGWMERFGGGMTGPTIDQLKSELSLTEEQVGKIQPIVDDARKKAQERFDELRQNQFQGFNWREEMDSYRKSQEELQARVKEHLTDEQKEKYDRFIQRRGFGNFGGNPPAPGDGGGRGRPSVDERVRRAMDALKVEKPDEAAVIKDAIKKVCEAQKALDDYERDGRGKIDEMARNKELKEEDIEAKLKELRAGRKDKDQAVKDAQKELSEIVTFRQELELVRQGILR